MTKMLNNPALGLFILRLSLGGMMLFHGVAKIMNTKTIGFIGGKLSAAGLPEFIAYGVFIGEVLAPLMIILGLYCRVGSILIIINMIFAVLLSHAGDIFALTKHGGWAIELQMFYLLTAVTLMFTGSGKMAIKPD